MNFRCNLNYLKFNSISVILMPSPSNLRSVNNLPSLSFCVLILQLAEIKFPEAISSLVSGGDQCVDVVKWNTGTGWTMNGNSGQFMISQFEAEADDDEIDPTAAVLGAGLAVQVYPHKDADDVICKYRDQELSIETSLSKLFNCMKLAYR